LGGLLGLGGVSMGTSVGLEDEAFGFALEGFQAGDIAVEFAGILSYELVAFPDLRCRQLGSGLLL
jgi:hypothetical protein